MIGSSIAHYRITAKLGEGGMGAVYRATDTKLGRDVAIKVLPNIFALDGERLARFTREAQVLASLNHPNIAAIYGVEERALVMELVEGAVLQGPVPLAVALGYARQIAEALEAAHEKGIVHRDLKPANVMVTAEGVVKVLDFGLAKAAEPAAVALSANSPTLTMGATVAGLIMGTAGYMSPEQAAGKVVDKRADIWAFGVVLYELVTGKGLFSGETVSHTLAHVLTREIDLTQAPAAVRPLLGRCLDRDLKARLRDIGEARVAIQILLAGPAEMPAAAVPTAPRSWLPRALAGAATLAVIGVWAMRPATPAAEPIEFQVSAPPGGSIQSPKLSPDGRKLAFRSLGGGKAGLYVRHLDRSELQFIPGVMPLGRDLAWSPDSTRVAVRAGEIGASVLTIVNLQTNAVTKLGAFGRRTTSAGLTWGEGGYLLADGVDGRIVKIAETGGKVEDVMPFDGGRGESDQVSPRFLAGGRRFLYRSTAKAKPGTYLASLDGGKPEFVGETVEGFVFVRLRDGKGAGLFQRGNQILIRPFDTDGGKFTGAEQMVVSGVGTGILAWSAANGVLAYEPEREEKAELVWHSRGGGKAGAGTAGFIGSFRISPDETRLAYGTIAEDQGIWLLNLLRGGLSRLSLNAETGGYPVWSPDNRWIAFGSSDAKGGRLVRRAADGTGMDETLLEDTARVYPLAWSPDGKWLLFRKGRRGNWDLYFLPVGGSGKPVPFVIDSFDKVGASISPDGKWVAYCTNESGRQEVYAQPRPESAGGGKGLTGKWQISTNSGVHPRWRKDGKELYYHDFDGNLQAVSLEAGERGLRASAPKMLLSGLPAGLGPTSSYDASQDGNRFLVAETAAGVESVTVVVNWESRLK